MTFLGENFQLGVVSCADFKYYIKNTILAIIHISLIKINLNTSYAEIEKMSLFLYNVGCGQLTVLKIYRTVVHRYRYILKKL